MGRRPVRLVEADLTSLGTGPLSGSWDVLFANASLQWIPDHPELLAGLVRRLTPGGQLHLQVPANYSHPSHTVADEIGRRFGLEPLERAAGALAPAAYAEILHELGLVDLDIALRVYPHEMARTDDVVEWVSGTLLNHFHVQLGDDDFGVFRREYRTALLDRLGDPGGAEPYFHAFSRILCSGRVRGLSRDRDDRAPRR